ncbi:ubiquitin-conjugating enzyme E2 [Cavenderia fasciculata]|uniref:Ubiquitin-conjugating enzyme E2 n=1 Tax=Cavenderia fasciculata TaxID=261658 RepID=F4Q8W1_CACFS|nr:ubiquitin-conjugating enzyme E2 [Cavenderia fasciculata]EGG15130.1 ubiquitin-conjugating enzyme E2 [Cavenderia fasciculata]|eukprot:XP_004351850.1 ubiquitin-conjugating enzyme E2 [Cavenderia fasciculata]
MASKLLQNQFKKIQSEPIEGVFFELVDQNLFEWKAYVEGPKETDYDGGIFQILMKFPQDYPMSPPTLTFTSEFWHPNVYLDGRVCISILHPPVLEDETSGELPEERWLPTQTVTTILLSVISLLSAPNTSSPANVDASVEWRNEKDAYKKRIKTLIAKANLKVPQHVVIPHPDSDPVERAKQVEKMKLLNKPMDFYDDYDDAAYDDDDHNDDYDYDDEDNHDYEDDEDYDDNVDNDDD